MLRKPTPSHPGHGRGNVPAVSPITLRLRELREARGLTQRALAESAGISQATVARLESGSLRNVTLDTVERLADALGVPAGRLITHTPRRRG
jgi:transcriptional regulator with XRE-family HTH domain